MKKKAIQGIYVVFLIGCLMLVGLLTPSWGANKAEEDLINAAGKGDLAQIKSLIAAGVDVNAKNNDGYTALTLASKHGNDEVVKLLRQAGAKE
jgi:ankyrin repeat protein